MYIINDTYFQAPKREIPNLDEADSRAFAELERLIDEKCRLFLQCFLTSEEITEFDSYLVNGMFPEVVSGIPQKWVDLVNGKGDWKGLVYSLGTAKESLLADYVYYFYLVDMASYMTGVGDAKANPKGATNVNPTQRIVRVWNDFVKQYQGSNSLNSFGFYSYENRNSDVYSLIEFLCMSDESYDKTNRRVFETRNQLGL